MNLTRPMKLKCPMAVGHRLALLEDKIAKRHAKLAKLEARCGLEPQIDQQDQVTLAEALTRSETRSQNGDGTLEKGTPSLKKLVLKEFRALLKAFRLAKRPSNAGDDPEFDTRRRLLLEHLETHGNLYETDLHRLDSGQVFSRGQDKSPTPVSEAWRAEALKRLQASA